MTTQNTQPRTYARVKPKTRLEATYSAPSTSTVTAEPVVEPLEINWPQADPEIDSFQLIVEAVPNKCLSEISGYRIVDLKHVIQWAMLMERHRNMCESSQIDFVGERLDGFRSELIFKCNMCDKAWRHFTESSDKINTACVWTTVTSGSFYTQAADITSLMDIPTMSANKFRRIEKKLGSVWFEHLTEEIKIAGEQERSIAIKKGHVSSDGVPFVTLYVDGGWLKRSYGHNYDSSSGMILANTKLPLSGRNILKPKVMKLTLVARKIIMHSSAHTAMAADLRNGPLHVFGVHENCKDYYCNINKTLTDGSERKEENLVESLKNNAPEVWALIYAANEKIALKQVVCLMRRQMWQKTS
ncbi:unnamed protein product [Parnassius apollo]|uniref:(apollo) hypothetical protein n=1 Tax=Parnassius apollo TaxID=110799 RepID=A0A8S3X0L8_PARAO|nr:unnamed protein product [Parnassius apollo]